MLDFITETNSVWQNMRHCGLPLVLYGMGNGADAVLDRMAAEGLTAAGILPAMNLYAGRTSVVLRWSITAILKPGLKTLRW